MKKEGPLILIIDDELQIRRMLRLSLEAHGYSVIDATRAEEGLQLVAAKHPDLIILDLELPDIGGLEVLRDLRQWCQTPVIVLTIRTEERDKIELLDSGANDYMTKPFGMGELLARIRAVIRHRVTGGPEGIFQSGKIKIDFSQRQVTKNNIEIKFTPTEYSLLRFFAVNAGKICTQEQLLKELWGPEFQPDTSYLRVYILQLRRKIEDDPSNPKILITEQGIGYRLVLSDNSEIS